MNTCVTCEHFQAPAANDEWAGRFGRCTLIPMTGQQMNDWNEYERQHGEDPRDEMGYTGDAEWMEKCHPGVGAYTSDASGYASGLNVAPDFGCVEWEAKAP